VVEHGTPLKGVEPADRVRELQGFITALEKQSVSIRVLQKLALLCLENPTIDPASPSLSNFSIPASPSPFNTRAIPSLHSDMWIADKNFERLFNALIKFLDPSRVRFWLPNRHVTILIS
jgi:CLIP-associating protein 1/2